LLPVLQALIQHRFPQLVGNPPATANITVEAEDMLFALLGGQVDQRNIAPPQGNLMNPPIVFAPPQPAQPSAPVAAQNPSSRPASHSPVDHRVELNPGQQQPPPPQIKQENVVPSQRPVPASYTPNQAAFPSLSAPSSGFNTSSSTPMWNPQMMALPLVNNQPSTNPMEGYHNQLHYMGQPQAQPQQQPQPQPLTQSQATQQGQQGPQQGQPGQQGNERNGGVAMDGMVPMGGAAFGDLMGGLDNLDLWARLQTFYEPTPSYWGQSAGGVQGGYVDYAGMGMGM
jgi:hypothetical protein